MMITICGKKRSGKDTVAKMLETKMNALSYALAGPIKTSLTMALDRVLPGQFFIGDIEGETGYDRESDMHIDDKKAARIMREFWFAVYQYRDVDYTEIFHRTDEYLIGNQNQPWSVRRFMQVLGTDIGVYVQQDIWVSIFNDMYVYLHNVFNEPVVIMTDCRQVHEISYARENKSVVIHIVRDSGEADNHITEAGIEPIEGEIILHNNGSLADLEDKVNLIVEQLRELQRDQ